MKNTLFLICPAAQVEHFIRKKYGKNAFFLTALGAVFTLQDQAYLEELAHFMEREAIAELVVVNDISCRFIHSVLNQQKGFGTQAEQVLIDLLLDQYACVTSHASLPEQKARLAALNVQRQLDELLDHAYLLQQVALQKLVVKCMVTDSAAGQAKTLTLPSSAFSI